MPLPDGNLDWRALWADLLKGAGRGLLELDGSRVAQAAIAGLDTFEAAQEKRRDRDGALSLQAQIDNIHPDLELSAAEWAHLSRLSPEERDAWLREMAEADRGQDDNGGRRRRPGYGGGDQMDWEPLLQQLPYPSLVPTPLSANPYEGWSLASTLPFGANGHLNIPTLRR